MDAATNPQTRRAHRWLTAGLVAAVLVQAVVGVGLILARSDLAQNQREDDTFETCIARWQQSFATAYDARASAAAEASIALDQVVRAVDRSDSERFGVAIDNYLEVRAEQDRERQENPLPPLPEDLCGQEP